MHTAHARLLSEATPEAPRRWSRLLRSTSLGALDLKTALVHPGGQVGPAGVSGPGACLAMRESMPPTRVQAGAASGHR